MTSGIITQDTIRPVLEVRIKTDNLLPDSIFRRLDEKPAFLRNLDSGKLRRSRISTESLNITDTTSVCSRNSIADVTFHDSLNFIADLKKNYTPGPVPFKYAEKNREIHEEQQISVITTLKDGIALPAQPLHNDWIIAVILICAYLYLVVRSATRRMWPELTRYFMLRGINESSSRDTVELFSWQSTLHNLISFIILGLFAFCVAAWFDFVPKGISPAIFILISFGIIVSGITSRHFICLAAGNLSGEADLFNEYLVSIYQSYRFSSIFIFIIVVLLVYTSLLPPQVCLFAGVAVLGVFYFYRVLRLSLIFLKKDISILYLILYLCALEILPVLILSKYFKSLV